MQLAGSARNSSSGAPLGSAVTCPSPPIAFRAVFRGVPRRAARCARTGGRLRSRVSRRGRPSAPAEIRFRADAERHRLSEEPWTTAWCSAEAKSRRVSWEPLKRSWSPTVMPLEVYCHIVYDDQPAGSGPTVEA